MQLRITDAYRTRVRKVHNNGDNELAKQVPQKRAGGGCEINMQQIVALSHKGRLSIACVSCEKSYMRQTLTLCGEARPECTVRDLIACICAILECAITDYYS